jgi:TM2 domain-containing membrane protein YozV
MTALSDSEVNSKKIVAGLMGIFFGGLGIHKFILGFNGAGVAMLVPSLVVPIVTCGFGFFVPIVMHIVGLIEGIIYLTKTNEEFRDIYIEGKKEWF